MRNWISSRFPKRTNSNSH